MKPFFVKWYKPLQKQKTMNLTSLNKPVKNQTTVAFITNPRNLQSVD